MQPNMISQHTYEAERRRKLAETLSKSADRQVGSNLDGLAKVLQMGVAGYQGGKADKATRMAEDAKREALSKALDGSISRDERIKTLAGVPGYEGDAVKASLESGSAGSLKEQAESALIAQAAGQPLTPEQTSALKAYDTLRQTERMYDPRQNIVPKFSPLLGGEALAGGAPSPAPARNMPQSDMPLVSQVPAGGLLPPPAAGQTPDASMFAPPPAGLDAKAQGQYMDAMAADAAKRAQNGGMPDLTERQAKATAFAARMEQAEAEMGNAIKSNPAFNPSNVVDNVAASILPPQFRNIAISPEYQQVRAAQENFITGLLRLDSGAAIPPAELEAYIAQYFPVAGDTKATIEQKARARQAALEATKAEAAGGYNVTSGRLENMGLGRGLPQVQQTQPVAPASGQRQRLRFNPATGELE